MVIGAGECTAVARCSFRMRDQGLTCWLVWRLLWLLLLSPPWLHCFQWLGICYWQHSRPIPTLIAIIRVPPTIWTIRVAVIIWHEAWWDVLLIIIIPSQLNTCCMCCCELR